MPIKEDVFATTIQKTNKLLKELGKELGWKDKNSAYSALRAVLHTLRDRLSVEEAVDLGSQLPMLIRGFYFEGWKPSKVPVKMNKNEFKQKVIDQIGIPVGVDIDNLIKTVLKVLSRYITPGEIKDLRAVLPKFLREFLP